MRIDVRVRRFLGQFARIVRACAGLPDYDAYLAHCRAHHADTPPLDRASFMRDREAARYGRGRSRCC